MQREVHQPPVCHQDSQESRYYCKGEAETTAVVMWSFVRVICVVMHFWVGVLFGCEVMLVWVGVLFGCEVMLVWVGVLSGQCDLM